MSEQIRFQSVLITGQQQKQASILQTQPAISPNEGFDNLTYSTSNYYVQNNVPASYETQKQTSYVQQANALNANQMNTNNQITAKHSTTQMNSKKQRQKINNDSDSDNDDGIFCGVRTETKPKSMQIDLPVEQTTRGDSEYGVCLIF